MEQASAAEVQLKKGLECLLNVTGRHFKVTVLEVGPDTIRVTFPGRDYPIDGIGADLEFHDDTGFFYYPTQVIQGPAGPNDGVLLRRLPELRRNVHRQSFRATTDLTVQAKDQSHCRWYNAALIDISAGGALIGTEAPFDFSTIVELTLGLPGEPSATLVCHVIHIAEGVAHTGQPIRYVGLRFVDLDADVEQSIVQFIWQRLRQIYPSGVPHV